MFLIPYTKRLFAVCWAIPFILLTPLAACGGGGSNSEALIQINTAPQLIGLIDFAIDENTTEITTIQATDAEGDNITYSIEGSDSVLMTIGSLSGELSFVSPPDYENPQDSNQDNIYEVTIIASDGSLSSSLGIIISINDVLEGMGGSNMLLMGNSFFRPYAERFSELALDADFLEHQDTLVFRGGDNGTPIGLWTNEDTNTEIKQILDSGNIEILGMTWYFDENSPLSGFTEWIDYALQNNPNIKIFLSIPPIDFPADWQQRAEGFGYNNIRDLYGYVVSDYTHKSVIDQLRERYPSTEIFTLPTGWATFDLVDQYENNLLLDDISLFGSYDDSIFTDAKGHQGKIVVNTGALIWLTGLYKVNLRTNDADTGFNTDLHTIAENIMDLHDQNYKQQ
ncbi:MAG: cadherin repeat domain-containing protein [Pseudomonadota bacterium]|nr:cadherin repeat domain-containing protein [Pseudomonadota bacterium]